MTRDGVPNLQAPPTWRWRAVIEKPARARVLALLCAATTASILGLAVYVALAAARGNFHAVVPGQVYRSAQPSPAAIASYRRTVGIRTILNLRGENAGASWYDDEVAASRAMGIRHVDFRMSAREGLTTQEAWRLIALMRALPKPILVHCESGSDRSGLAGALYLAAVEHTTEDQLSLRFGHINAAFAKGYGVNRTFEAMEASLGYAGS